MITNFNNHASNERTYLSWIRTAIAVMAFGFLIEKFAAYALEKDKVEALRVEYSFFNLTHFEMVGLLTFFSGALMVVLSTVRFFSNLSRIEATGEYSYVVGKVGVFVPLLIFCVAIFLLGYLGHRIALF